MICRLCLIESATDIFNMFDEEGIRLQIADIISKHFWFSPSRDDHISDKICCSCWTKVNNFHEFYCFIEGAQNNLIKVRIPSRNQISVKPETLDNLKKEQIFCDESNNSNNDNTFRNNTINKKDPLIHSNTDVELENLNSPKLEANQNCRNTLKEETFTKALSKSTLPSDAGSNSDASNGNLEIEQNMEITLLMLQPNRKRRHERDSKKQKKQNLDTNSESTKLAQKKKTEEEDEQIANYIQMNCDTCYENFKTFSQLKSHIKKEHKKKSGYVICCNKKIFKRPLLLDHLNIHIDPDAFSCKICGKKFKNADYLKCHEASQHNADESDLLGCDKCEKKFSKKYLLDKHKLMHAPPEERHFECNICKKSYASNTNLNAHIRSVHQRLYDLVCDICAKKLSCRKLLEKHRLEHDGITEPKVQCQKCGSWQKNERNLKKHMKRHEETQLSFKCEHCDRVVVTKNALREHVRFVHEKQRIFKCTFCEKAFKHKVALKEHIATHTGGTLYSCSFCLQTFNSKANMYSHRKKSHPKEWEELNRQRITSISAPTSLSIE